MIALFRNPALVGIARVAIGLLFIAAALGKLGDLAAFAQQVHNYRLLPLWGENFVAIALPWIEVLAGLALVLGIRPRSGAVIVLALMVIFTVAVGAAWARGLDFECGCFGKATAGTIGAKKFLENIGMLALAAMASVRPAR